MLGCVVAQMEQREAFPGQRRKARQGRLGSGLARWTPLSVVAIDESAIVASAQAKKSRADRFAYQIALKRSPAALFCSYFAVR